MKTNVKATLLAVRAIGVVFGKKIWWTVVLIAAALAVVLIALCVWLTSLSGWWWILAVIVGMAISIAFVILAVFRALLAYINPTQTQEQKTAVKDFVEKLQFVQELTQTPKFIILFRVIRSVAAPSSEKYLENIFESRKLKADFERVVGLF
ncbi:hypothetical protein KI440_00050 [Candidatus Saccharibacteria bacterium TM7i]|nr:hypothetical protein KI440_00050 [Candidatus Saccharibacteria bacterium TM7i]